MKKEKILLSLCGMSPAVLTEAAYALCSSKPSFVPDRVIAITTSNAVESIKNELFDNDVWTELRKELKLPSEKLRFGLSSSSIRIINSEGYLSDASDIISSDDTSRTADFILEQLRALTENPDTEIVFSIAGGRKSMTAVAALSMTLQGRSQDRLCHVIVDSPYDNPNLLPKFYFPSSKIKEYTLDDEIVKKKPQIHLSDIPFVRCRNIFTEKYGRLPGSYKNVVDLTNEAFDASGPSPTLTLIPEKKICRINNTEVKFGKKEYVLYWMLAHRRKHGENDIAGLDSLLDQLRLFSTTIPIEKFPEILVARDGLNNESVKAEDIRKLPANIRSQLKKAGLPLCDFEICSPSRRSGVYGINVSPSNIECPEIVPVER